MRDERPPVAPSFAARRKIEEKGVPRGCGPLNPRGNVLEDSDVLCAYHLATVRLTRLSRAWHASHCFHALCVLRCSEKQQDLCNHPTSDYKSGWLFFKFQQFLCITCSTIESVEAVCLHTPQTGLNRVNCITANTCRVGTSPLLSPRIKSQIPKGGFGALWRVFLPYLSSRKERYGHRRSSDE